MLVWSASADGLTLMYTPIGAIRVPILFAQAGHLHHLSPNGISLSGRERPSLAFRRDPASPQPPIVGASFARRRAGRNPGHPASGVIVEGAVA